MRFRIGVVLCTGVLMASGCSGGSPKVESQTPRMTVDDTAISESLLDEQDLVDLVGEVHAQSINATEVFENPDPRGPCGADSPPVPTAAASGRAFVSDRATVIQLVLPRSDETDAFMDAHLSDIVDPCGPFESTTNTGSVQHVLEIDVVELPNAGGYVGTAQITNQGQTAFAAFGAAQSEDLLTVIFVIGVERIELADARPVVERAADRL